MVLRIFTILASSGFLTALDFTKFVFGWGSTPDSPGGASPDFLAVLRGPTSKGKAEGREKGRGEAFCKFPVNDQMHHFGTRSRTKNYFKTVLKWGEWYTCCAIRTSYTQQTPITVMPCSLHSIATATSVIDSTSLDHTAQQATYYSYLI